MPVLPDKHYLFGGLFAFVLCTPVAADNEEAIARCSKIASVGDQILCLKNALRRASGDSNRVSDTDELATPEAVTVEPESGAADLAVADSKSKVTTDVRDVEEPASEELVPSNALIKRACPRVTQAIDATSGWLRVPAHRPGSSTKSLIRPRLTAS